MVPNKKNFRERELELEQTNWQAFYLEQTYLEQADWQTYFLEQTNLPAMAVRRQVQNLYQGWEASWTQN